MAFVVCELKGHGELQSWFNFLASAECAGVRNIFNFGEFLKIGVGDQNLGKR